ncbi:hypothetical protein [Pontibacter harenae]|uniref:hypothetical protein n=1 Tax=Pontibacter harenae TaxID=2894083 RepID=UPI001E421A97|nr:hypothetical protein [Pontibacter harenae]MCC9167572.1 hypothetical protein [Pontibacter harenae]
MMYLKRNIKLSLLLLSFGTFSCQSNSQDEKTIASTHPKLEEELNNDSVSTPVTPGDTSNLYNRYRITMDQYTNSRNYDVRNMYGGSLGKLDEESHEDARTYRSALTKGLAKGVNFAGNYTVVTVGCGNACQNHYIIDSKSGKVLDKIQSSAGAKFSPNSRLFILNPPDSTVNYSNCHNCEPKAYVFENGQFKEAEK